MLKIRNYFIAFAVVFAISSAYALVGIQDVKAQEGGAYTDLIKRIEALEAKKAGNVTTGARGMKLGFDIRHRVEVWDQRPNTSGTAARDNYFFDQDNSSTVVHEWATPGSNGDTAGGRDQSGPGRGETLDFTLQRIRITLDADVHKNLRALVKLQDSRAYGAEGSAFGATGTLGNLERTDVLEAYVDLRSLGDLNPLLNDIELRIGRWQYAYGNHRLLGTLNWTNQGRSYDGARVKWDDKKGNWIDLFAASIEEKGDPAGFATGDDTSGSGFSDIDEVLYGVYTHFKVYDGTVFEPYFIARARSLDFKRGADSEDTGEQRYTVGFRLDGKNIPGLGGLDFTIEPAWQFGKVEGQRGELALQNDDKNPRPGSHNVYDSNTIQAFAGYAGVGYTFKDMPWSPRVGAAYVWASGDDRPHHGSAKTFDHLYPTGHAQLGYMDQAAWQNIRDYQVHLSAKPTKKLVLDLKVHFFRLDEVEDAWYAVPGGTGWGGGRAIIRGGANVFTRDGGLTFEHMDPELGQEVDFTVKYKLFKNLGIVAGYSHYFAGDFIEDTGKGIDRGIDWAYLQTTLKF